ncbi:MAG: tetratricopeptide repeat protein [Spartobacteria bacterium]|nr:tetratricopeptide repeat protein [Spartobacteria bacterium]
MAEVKLEDVPRKVREMFDKGFAAFERGNLDYAMDLFISTLDLEPRLLHARKYLRAAQLKNNKDKKGGAFARKMASLTSLPAIASASAAINKHPLKALHAGEELMCKDPLNMAYIKVLGKAATAAEMPEVAIQALEIAKDNLPKDPELLNWLGSLYLEVGDPARAKNCFEEVSRMRPNDQAALKALKDASALATMKKGNWETGTTYQDMLKDSKGSTLLEQEGKAVKTSKDIDALIKETTGKIQREPENVNYRRALADLYVKASRFDEAIQALLDAQKIAGGADPQIDLAVSSAHVKKFEHEIKVLREAGDESAAAAMEAEKKEFQFNDAKSRVARYPNDLQFKYELGVLLYERGELNEAIQQLQQAQRNPQRRIMSLYHLALCFEAKNQYDIAMEQLQKAASELTVMDGTKKDILYEIGKLAETMQDAETAVQYYKEIYAVDIGYKDVADKIEKAYKKSE